MKENKGFIATEEGRGGLSFSLFIFFYLSAFLLFFIVLLAFVAKQKDLINLVLNFSSYALAVIVLFITIGKEERKKVDLIKKFNPLYLLLAVVLSLGMLSGFGFINVALSDFLSKIGVKVSSTTLDLSTAENYIKYLIFFALAPAIFEEIFFRGILLRGIKGNIIIASLLSALCFSLYHFSLSQLVYQFIYGFFLSILAIRSGSIIPAIVAHFLNNYLVISIEYYGIAFNLFSPWTIVVGLLLISVFIFFALFFKREKPLFCEEKFKTGQFFMGASIGLLISIIMMVGTAIG